MTRQDGGEPIPAGAGIGKIRAGASIPVLDLEAISGDRTPVPDPGRLVHLQFRRFAGCPVCNLHLQSVAARHDEIEAAGIREVAFFHSTADSLKASGAGELPFAVIPDPDKRIYRQFGVEASWRSVADPRAWSAEIRGLAARLRNPRMSLGGGPLGLPADFLIASDGRVLAGHYGVHADDQWTVDELLAQARNHGPTNRP